MKSPVICCLLSILTCVGIHAQDKIPLKLPLNLTPGISHDSASTVLTSLGAGQFSSLENNFSIEFTYAGIRMERAVPVFLKSKLISLSMFSGWIGDKGKHVARLKAAYVYVMANYDCRLITDNLSVENLAAKLDDGIELATFTSDDYSLFLNSEYKPGEGYAVGIHLYSVPLTIPSQVK